jgi:hypothetical protein
MTLVRPRQEAYVQEAAPDIQLTSSKGAAVAGALVIAATLGLYAMFW